MTAFMEEYEKVSNKDNVGVPGIVMNRPFIPVNTLADIGLELEIEGESLPSAGRLARLVGEESRATWTTKADGSLRGEALEYVLVQPCKVSEVDTLVNGLYDVFKTNGTNLQLSNRCSTHVHVNMGGKKINDITSAITLWTAFEEPLTLWAGEERVNNHFCLGAKDCNSGTVTAWRSFLRTGRQDFNDSLKYSALNILTLFRFGSLEYRVMNASQDPEKITDWTKFIYHLTRYATDKFANPATMAYSMSERGGRELFLEICEKAGVSSSFVTGVIDTVPNINDSVMQGFRRAQPIVAGFPWHDWYDECKKEYIEDPFGKKKKKSKLADYAGEWLDVAPPPPGIRMDAAVDPAIRFAPQPIWRQEIDIQGIQPVQPPAAPGDIRRPPNVPLDFVYKERTRKWVKPDFDFEAHCEVVHRMPTQEYTAYVTNGMRITEFDLRSGKVKFYDNTATVVSTGTILEIKPETGIIIVIADTNLVSSRGQELGLSKFAYEISTGHWSGDSRVAFIH